MSEPEEHYGLPVLPEWRWPTVERANERRRPVLDAIQTLIAVRDLLLPVDAEDRTNAAVVARVRELADRERADEDDGR